MDSESVVSQVQRRIELQSPEDLSYLVANVRRAAAARVDEAFPHVEGREEGGDELRDQIEALVNEYIDRTFGFAAPNISVNGLPATVPSLAATAAASSPGPDPVYEPFDTRKRRHVADLIAQEEKLREDVAALKRSVPAAAAAQHAAALAAGLRQDEESAEQRAARAAEEAAAAAGVNVDIDPLERQADMEERFRGAVAGLGGLKRELPAVVAKMERARVAGEYVVTEGRR